MGCWNETCAVTNLPIHHGDRVKLFVFRKDKNYNCESSDCYSDISYRTFGLPISGIYDDYGCIEEIDINEKEEILLTHLKQNIKKSKRWEEMKKYEDENLNTLEGVLRFIERDYSKNFKYMMVLESVYDNVCNFDLNLLSKVKKKLKEHYNFLLEQNSSDAEISRYCLDDFLPRYNHCQIVEKAIILENLKNKIPYNSIKIFDDIMNFTAFSFNLCELRRDFREPLTKGSQSDGREIYLKLNNVIGEIIHNRNKKDLEENSDQLDLFDFDL